MNRDISTDGGCTSHSEIDETLFATPSLPAPSLRNQGKRRHLNLSPNSPVDTFGNDKLDEILSIVRSSQSSINELNKVIKELVTENCSLKIDLEWLIGIYDLLNSEMCDLKATNKDLLNEPKYQQKNSKSSNSASENQTSVALNMAASTSSSKGVISFTDALKRPTAAPSNALLILKPKDVSQKSEATMDMIKTKITPKKLKVKKARHTENGGISIECGSKEAAQNLKTIAELVLGQSSYTVSAPEKRQPRVKCIGMSEIKTVEDIEADLRAQNDEIFNETYKITISGSFEVRSRYGFRMEVDSIAFNRLMMYERNRLRIGWDLCTVYEAFSIIRCYNCWRFHHTSKECKSQILVCGKCSGDHISAACVSENDNCINCTEMKSKIHLNIDCSHPAWIIDCNVYKLKIEFETRNVN